MLLKLNDINLKDSDELLELLKKNEPRSYTKFFNCIDLLQKFSDNKLICNYDVAPYLRKRIRKLLNSNIESNGNFLIFGYFVIRKTEIYGKTKIINFSMKWDSDTNVTKIEILNIIGHEDSLNQIKIAKIITNIELLINYFSFNEFQLINENFLN